MKRIIIFILIITLLTSCSVRSATFETTEATVTYNTESDTTEAATIEAAPVYKAPVGIYSQRKSASNTEAYDIVKEVYYDDMSHPRDLNCFAVFPSLNEGLDGKYYKDIWAQCVSKDVALSKYKVGFFLEYTLLNGTAFENTIKKPSDIRDDFWDYIEIYIYDDVNQVPGVWYSHLLESEFTDKTILTSIKITAGSKIKDVKEIYVTAFLYEGENDFDASTGKYTSASSYKIQVVPSKNR